MEKKTLSKKFWASLIIFGLVGQIAWTVENMYFNVFIYKMFNASEGDIALMVALSSVAATLTTILIGALSDKIGKRKIFICLGYILWGAVILAFAFVRVDFLSPYVQTMTDAFALGVMIVIVLDCVMTFLGSGANDAAFNAWLTDMGDETNRGKIEGFNSIMPLVAILVVFGSFMGFNLDEANSWTTIYIIIGAVVILIGVLGFFLIEEDKNAQKISEKNTSYIKTLVYSFRPSVVANNKLLYAVLGTFAVFGISIQTFMPYLIIYYEKTLQLANYALIMAPAIIVASVITAFFGRAYDMQGFKKSAVMSVAVLLIGYAILFFFQNVAMVFIGSLFMMTGYMTGISVFNAMIRDNTPKERAGQFQGVRIIAQVLIPGVIGPAIGAFVLRDADKILNGDGTYSFLPNENIWAASFIVGVALVIALTLVFIMMRRGKYTLTTESGEMVKNGKESWNNHPRPQLYREDNRYLILNDGWTLNGKRIKLPFAPNSDLSEYTGKKSGKLVYGTSFTIPDNFKEEKVFLRFGAVDQIAKIWLNDLYLGVHEGGYLPFGIEITPFMNKENTLKVEVKDALSHKYPYGKQKKLRGGMWYTPVSGIWKSVWLENVTEDFVEEVVFTPDLTGVDIKIDCSTVGFKAIINVGDGKIIEREFDSNEGRVTFKEEDIHLWSVEDPFLYDVTIVTRWDRVKSYFALRTVEIKNVDGVNRVCLNGKPIFMHGVLDQGYFPDGIYTPADENEFERDILRMKELGFNTLRKHIKIESEEFYYACDKLGMLVVQDMVNSGPYHFLRDTALPTLGFKKRKERNFFKKTFRKNFFIKHMQDTVRHLYNHPCIIAYTIFNEGWGQFESDKAYELLKSQDNTRLVDTTSGWFAQNKSDFDSEHIYFKAVDLTVKERPMFLSEFGGYSLPVQEHYYAKYSSYGYGVCENEAELTVKIKETYEKMVIPFISKGLCGCIYTQLSDVEDEINGLYTYDRKVCKVIKEDMVRLAQKIYEEI